MRGWVKRKNNHRKILPHNKVKLIEIILVGLAVIAGYTDWRWRKIFNWTTFSAIVLGFGLNFVFYHWAGLKQTGIAVGIIFLMVFPLVYFDIFGPGDAKLLMAIAALRGWEFSLYSLMYGAIVAGGAMAVILIIHKKVSVAFNNIKQIFLGFILQREPVKINSALPPVPFGLFVSIGVILRLAEIYFIR